ncbi:MAG TPA: NAD(P)H-hydrate dehydratase [Candidatus Methanomethylophilaceae archaeon]|nr:NAD(P)H-hydrate dehydratase [Candidatus Methanomethylophilaceae archaeon]
MIPLSESRILDINAESLGIDTNTLMGNAGAALVKVLKQHTGKRFLFVCGSGNNGGDGFAAAGKMDDEDVTVCLLGLPSFIRSDASNKYYSELTCPIIQIADLDIDKFDVLVDCALGSGISGKLREPYLTFVMLALSFKGFIISADIPTGLGCTNQIIPDVTVTFHDVKTGMTTENSGKIIIADIGIPESAEKIVGPGDMLRYPLPHKDSHKGCNGRILIIGGGPYCGAPAMSGLAALRVGADLVNIAVPENISNVVASYSPEFIVTPLSKEDDPTGRCDILLLEHVPHLLGISNNYDAVLIGPGLGVDKETAKAINDFIFNCKIPMVIDADAINSIGLGFKSDVPAIFTPHGGEFINLGGRDALEESNIRDLATSMNSIILLKGETDIISNGERMRLNTTGTPAMTTAGTGDVLAGVVTGLLSKGMDAFDAACLGAYICGKAGEHGFEKKSYGLIATDVINSIPFVLNKGLR